MIFFQVCIKSSESRIGCYTWRPWLTQLAAVLTVIRSCTLIRGYVLCVFKVYSSLSRFMKRCELTLEINTAATHWERRSRTSVKHGLFCVSHRTASTGGFNKRETLYHLLKLLVNQASTESERWTTTANSSGRLQSTWPDCSRLKRL